MTSSNAPRLSEKTRGRLRFFARQILDTMSSANYLATNPQAKQRALETGGDSLALGVKNISFWIGGKLGKPDRWLETAKEKPGSWWSDWSQWLQPLQGDQVTARTDLGSRRFHEIEPAPGRYVKERAQ